MRRVLSWTTVIAIALTGCTAPERLPAFDVDWEEAKRDAARDTRGDAATRPVAPPQFDDVPNVDLPADGPFGLSLEQAAVLALTRNRELAVQRLEPVIASSFELIERGAFDPELFAELGYSRATASETDRGTGEQFSVDAAGLGGEAGLRQRLPSGTDVELSVEQSRDVSDRSPEQQEARLGLSVTQALLQGFGPAVNLARVRQAQIDTVASLFQLRGFVEALLAEVESAYWRYVLAAEEIEIFERSLAVAEQQRDDVRERIDVGLLAPTESAATEAEVALRRQALIDARSQLLAQRLRLLRLLNIEMDGTGFERQLSLSSDPTIANRPLVDLDERLELAQRLRPDLAEALLRLEQDRLEVIVTRNGLLPRLDLFAALGKTGFADTFAGSFEEIDSDTYDLTAGFRFSYFLGNDTARGLNRAAVATRAQAAGAIENLRQLIRLDVRLAAVELERARQLITASATTRRLQEATLAAEQERFDVGTSTTLLVAQAQRDLLAAEIAEVEAIVAYRLALIALYRAEGSLLERRGVTLDPPPDPSLYDRVQ